MKELILNVEENIYEEVKKFLFLNFHEKILFKENSIQKENKLSYEEFERKWAGFIGKDETIEAVNEERIDYLKNKHT